MKFTPNVRCPQRVGQRKSATIASSHVMSTHDASWVSPRVSYFRDLGCFQKNGNYDWLETTKIEIRLEIVSSLRIIHFLQAIRIRCLGSH